MRVEDLFRAPALGFTMICRMAVQVGAKVP